MSTKSTRVVAWSTSVDNSTSADKAQIMNEEEQRLEAHAERSSSFLYLLTEWAENTSWGGVPFIVKKSNYFFKAMWTTLVIAGLSVTAFQTGQVFDRFFKYPVNINVNITYTTKLTFPAVTICNVNILKASGFRLIPRDSLAVLATLLGNNGRNQSGRTSAERLRISERFLQVYNSMDYNIRINASHRKTDMILDCVFNGDACTTDDFFEWNDSTHGNCFTFNTGYDRFGAVALRHSYRTGPNYGLSIELYLQGEEYIEALTEIAGVKVIVHDQGSPPFPGDHGIYLQPASYSVISLQKANISRLPYPYPSNCVIINNVEDAKKLDAYVELFRTNYDLAGCYKSCYQAHVIKDCGCGDPKIPINTIATRSLAANTTAIYEPCADVATLACQLNVSQLFAEDLISCDKCRLPCSSIVYSHSVSSAKWPNEEFMETKLDYVSSINSNFAKYRVNATSPQNNILKFNIHFEELNYEVIYESPAYSSDSIYGDIGGVIGLWLGMSFIAIFELIQLMMDSLVLCITMLTTRKKRSRGNKMQAT